MSIDLHTLAGAYALDALGPADTEAFTKHLDECPACRDEVRELQEAAARLGASEAISPPSWLKARVLAAAAEQPQLPPRVTHLAQRDRRRWAPRLAGVAAAVALLVGAALGVDRLLGHDEPPSAQNPVSQVFGAPDAHVKTVRTSDGHVLKVATSAKSGRMALETGSLATLKGRHVYQLWAVHGGRARNIGLIENLSRGTVLPIPASGTRVAITVEPEGGSRQPTSTPIVEMDPAAI
jgi:anti-sigma-K factor RskA